MTQPVSRRAFLVSSAAATAALGIRGAEAAAWGTKPRKQPTKDLPAANIGAQLYSVSDQTGSIGFPALFHALATIGYKHVEFAGYANKDGFTPQRIKKLLADHGLKAVGNHGAMDDASLEGALQVGQRYTGLSFLSNIKGVTLDAWKGVADDLNAYGERCVKEGLKGFYVHMHGPEYLRVADDPSKHVIDVLLANTDPRYVFWEMDIYWAYFFQGYLEAGGTLVDPLQWVLKNPKRFPLFHVKDGKRVADGNTPLGHVQLASPSPGTYPLADGICDVGQGEVDFKHFFSGLAKVSNLNDHYFLWERDSAGSHPHGSLASARCSYQMIAHGRLVDPTTPW